MLLLLLSPHYPAFKKPACFVGKFDEAFCEHTCLLHATFHTGKQLNRRHLTYSLDRAEWIIQFLCVKNVSKLCTKHRSNNVHLKQLQKHSHILKCYLNMKLLIVQNSIAVSSFLHNTYRTLALLILHAIESLFLRSSPTPVKFTQTTCDPPQDPYA